MVPWSYPSPTMIRMTICKSHTVDWGWSWNQVYWLGGCHGLVGKPLSLLWVALCWLPGWRRSECLGGKPSNGILVIGPRIGLLQLLTSCYFVIAPWHPLFIVVPLTQDLCWWLYCRYRYRYRYWAICNSFTPAAAWSPFCQVWMYIECNRWCIHCIGVYRKYPTITTHS